MKSWPMFPVLYGSQTGTAIHLAHLLARAVGNGAFVLSIDSFDITRLVDVRLAVFICSTHGDGQCPFNMVRFWTAITTDLPAVFSFKYAVLCLGDTSYQKYNWCGKMLYNRLKQLGAEPLLKVLANTQDKGGVYDGYHLFERELISLLRTRNDLFLVGNTGPESRCLMALPGPGSVPGDGPSASRLDDFKVPTKLYRATVISNKLVTNPKYHREVVEIVLDIPGYRDFFPGDCLGIWPTNRPDALRGFSYSLTETTYLLKHVDLNSVPHQTVFDSLACLTNVSEYRDKLREIAKDYDLYYSYAVISKRNILEVLDDFHISPPFEFMASLAKICPRYYSFSKIGLHFSILVSIPNYRTYMASNRLGLCSEYLKTLRGTIDVEIIPSRLFMEKKNLLFFATGSGITLPRSVLLFFRDKNIRIYYGFRSYSNDFLCKDELRDCSLYCAASMDDGKHVMEVYRENPVANIDDWLVFVSGNAGMNREVRRLLQDVHGKDVPFQSETW